MLDGVGGEDTESDGDPRLHHGLGAALGGKIGDTLHRKNENIDDLTASLQSSQRDVATLERDLDTLGSRIDHLNELARPELISLLQAGIAMDLLFRTDEHRSSRGAEVSLVSARRTTSRSPSPSGVSGPASATSGSNTIPWPFSRA